jgi:hypothetical protein
MEGRRAESSKTTLGSRRFGCAAASMKGVLAGE